MMVHCCCVLCLTSHQQSRSYGDGTTAYSIIRQTGEALDRTCDLFVYKKNRWFILCAARTHGAWNAFRLTEAAVYHVYPAIGIGIGISGENLAPIFTIGKLFVDVFGLYMFSWLLFSLVFILRLFE